MKNVKRRCNEKGAALITALLTLALLLALTMGISLTAISELGVTRTYGTQTQALQAAEAGLNHAASLVANYTGPDFTSLLQLRPEPLSDDYLTGNNPFVTDNEDAFATGSAMIDMEDPALGRQLRDAVTGAVIPFAFYRVSLIDDEPTTSPALPNVPNFEPGSTYRESVAPNANDPSIDKNNRMVIYSTGTFANASVTLEGWVAFLPYPAFSANDDITIGGNSNITGTYGGIHSNNNLIGTGNSWWVEQTATASGNLVGTFNDDRVGGFYGGGQDRLDLPPMVTTEPLTSGGPDTSPRLQDFLIRKATRLLMDPGYADGAHETLSNGNANAGTRRLASLAERLAIPYAMLAEALDSQSNQGNLVQQTTAAAVQVNRDSNGNVISIASMVVDDTGWSYSGTNSSWGITPNNNGLQAGGHSYYVVGVDNYNLSDPPSSTKNGGNVKLQGNVGSAGTPLEITIMTTGSIEISGTPNLTAHIQDLQTPLLPPFVKIDMLLGAVQDIKINGDVGAAISFTGVSYAGEQVELSGNGSVNGQVIALSNPHVSGTPVGSNIITGNFDLTLNDGNSIGRIKLFSWRQIKR